MLKRRIAAYLRVYTAEQAEEGYSIDAQENVITQKCEQDGVLLLLFCLHLGYS